MHWAGLRYSEGKYWPFNDRFLALYEVCVVSGCGQAGSGLEKVFLPHMAQRWEIVTDENRIYKPVAVSCWFMFPREKREADPGGLAG